MAIAAPFWNLSSPLVYTGSLQTTGHVELSTQFVQGFQARQNREGGRGVSACRVIPPCVVYGVGDRQVRVQCLKQSDFYYLIEAFYYLCMYCTIEVRVSDIFHILHINSQPRKRKHILPSNQEITLRYERMNDKSLALAT